LKKTYENWVWGENVFGSSKEKLEDKHGKG
jgi:hypothetical protein